MLFIFDLMKIALKIKKLTLFFVTVLFLAASSFIIHWIEPEVFTDPFIGFWYVMTTVTTTGYGDFVPQTTFGKIFGLILYFFGIGLIGLVIGKIVESFDIYRRLKEEGRLTFKGSDHYVIVGWSNKAKHTMYEILDVDDEARVVLIDSLPQAPMDHEKLYYIQGQATDKETLEKANVLNATAVLIFTQDNEINPVAADGTSLLTVSTIEGYALEQERDVYTIVEILKEEHIPMFKHANVDEFVLADEALSDLMAKSAIHKGSSRLIMKLLSRKSGVDIRKINKQQRWSTYNDAYEDLKTLGANLISDRNDFDILTKLDQPIPADAELYIICTKEMYKKLT
ncbi:potassium channel family protein [Desertibacillus haloalkaliphilus]|uniref:potassium channel family protein n=1 Tax=Desertibacillus haloalkaliphilus TaxID=1328930 RepID=UPI001C254C87|nr:potassium channel family protein [Desertibacillus haloalkaliphilus]MBU8905000.1 potassium channel family protein [Desertibacillus haloalkaliphilus]